jgi:hypothetical protein
MKCNSLIVRSFLATLFAAALILSMHSRAAAHCDTMDGPVVQDARGALKQKDVAPVLKWVRAKDEKIIKAAFDKALSAQGTKQQESAEKKFFESLVKIHRAGEGAPFTGLKPAGEVDPAVAAADKALSSGSADAVAKLVTDAVDHGIRQRYEKAAEALKHKDESVQKGREFVAAYVEYTHYVERLQMLAGGTTGLHHGEEAHTKQAGPKHDHGQRHGH